MPIRFTLKSFLLSAAVVLPASLAAADDSFERQDSNQDGVLSGREATDLKLLDQDSDGEISEAGFNDAARAQKVQVIRKKTMTKQHFKMLDKNEDGTLSGKEMKGLEDQDSDEDGEVSLAEFLAGP